MVEEEEEEEGEGVDQTNVFTGWASFESEIEYTFLGSKILACDNVVVCDIIKLPVTRDVRTKNTYKFNVTIFIS